MCSYSLVCEAAFITCEAGQWLGNGHVWSDWSLNEGGDNLGRLGRTTRCDGQWQCWWGGGTECMGCSLKERTVWAPSWIISQHDAVNVTPVSPSPLPQPSLLHYLQETPKHYLQETPKHTQNNYNDETDHRITWHCCYTFCTSAINISIQYPSLS